MDRKSEKQRKLIIGLFIVYVFAITWIILFKMEFGIPNMGSVRLINLVPFSDPVIINNKVDYSEMYMNALAFVPFGIFCGMLFTRQPFWKKCLPFMGASLFYEVMQFVLAIGRSDITDFINNSLGGILGLLIYMGFLKIIRDEYKANKIVLFCAVIGTVGMSILMALLIVLNM